MIYKPTEISPNNITFTASEDIKISWKTAGDIMYYYEVIFEDNDTGTQVFTSGKVQSFKAEYILPSNSLTDGKTYRYKIVVYNSANESATSNYVILKCYSRPIVTLLTNGTVRNQVLTIQANYTQAQGIELKSYRFVLYDEFDNVLEQSDYIYNKDLQYTFNYRLLDDTLYKVECISITQNDLLGTSGKVQITADYIPPSVHFNLQTETYVDKPYVRLKWTTVRIIGETTSEPNYINDEMLDLTNNQVEFNDGFNVERDFTIRMWLQLPSLNESEIGKIVAKNGNITLKFYDNRFHAFRTVAGVVTHVATSKIDNLKENDEMVVVLQQIRNNLNIYCEVISNE